MSSRPAESGWPRCYLLIRDPLVLVIPHASAGFPAGAWPGPLTEKSGTALP